MLIHKLKLRTGRMILKYNFYRIATQYPAIINIRLGLAVKPGKYPFMPEDVADGKVVRNLNAALGGNGQEVHPRPLLQVRRRRIRAPVVRPGVSEVDLATAAFGRLDRRQRDGAPGKRVHLACRVERREYGAVGADGDGLAWAGGFRDAERDAELKVLLVVDGEGG